MFNKRPVNVFCTLSLATIMSYISVSGALASMPNLTDRPQPNTLQACQQWASKQSSDAIEIWGLKEDGSSSKDFAISRLTSSCIGDSFSDLVGFGSSVGYRGAFCASHVTLKLCKDVEITYDEASLEKDASEAAVRFIVTKNLVKELGDQDIKRVFVSDLFNLFSRNARDFDADWLTGVQELQGVRVDAVKSEPDGPNKFNVDVIYHVNGVTEPDLHVIYIVFRDGWQWKIYDILFNGKSVRKQYR